MVRHLCVFAILNIKMICLRIAQVFLVVILLSIELGFNILLHYYYRILLCLKMYYLKNVVLLLQKLCHGCGLCECCQCANIQFNTPSYVVFSFIIIVLLN